MDANFILFAIEAGVKLGQKFYEVLVDANREQPIYLPLGDLFGSIQYNEANYFFRHDENGKRLFLKGGIYANLEEDNEITKAYHYVLAVMQQQGATSLTDEVYNFIVYRHNINQNIIEQLPEEHQDIEKFKRLPFDQLKKGEGHAPPGLRLIGVLVDTGIDYFQANPQALGKDSAARKVVAAFITRIESIDFEKEADKISGVTKKDKYIHKLQEIAGGVMLAGLQTFGENTNLLSQDKRIQVLLIGMTRAIVADFKTLKEDATGGTEDRRKEFYADVSSSLLRGAMAGFADNPTLFLGGDAEPEKIIRDTVTQVFKGLENEEDLFTPDSLEVILKSSLAAVSQDIGIITQHKILQQLVTGTVKAIVDGPGIFSKGTVAAILKNSLVALGENIGTLIDPDNPERLFLVETIAALTAGLTAPLSSGKLKDLLSTQQLISLSQIVFYEVAQHPEQLLESKKGDPKMTALAQIVGSVSEALGEDPKKLINGAGLLTLLQTAIRTAGQNIDKLLKLGTQNPADNLLCRILQALTEGFKAQGLPEEMFADTACRVIVTASNNLGFVTGGKPDVIPGLITKLMTLTAGQEIWNRLNSGNSPAVFEGLLRRVFFDNLDLENAGDVEAAVKKILESL